MTNTHLTNCDCDTCRLYVQPLNLTTGHQTVGRLLTARDARCLALELLAKTEKELQTERLEDAQRVCELGDIVTDKQRFLDMLIGAHVTFTERKTRGKKHMVEVDNGGGAIALFEFDAKEGTLLAFDIAKDAY